MTTPDTTQPPAGPCITGSHPHERDVAEPDICVYCGLYVDYWPAHAALVAVLEQARGILATSPDLHNMMRYLNARGESAPSAPFLALERLATAIRDYMEAAR